jgi:hypothetical protein
MIGGKPEDVIFTSGGTEVCEIHWFVKLVIQLLPCCRNLYIGRAMTLEVTYLSTLDAWWYIVLAVDSVNMSPTCIPGQLWMLQY